MNYGMSNKNFSDALYFRNSELYAKPRSDIQANQLNHCHQLHQKYLEEAEKEKNRIRGDFVSAEWGSQIRSYVLHPYKMVKDHRTKYETADAARVLDGDLDSFIEAYLKSIKN